MGWRGRDFYLDPGHTAYLFDTNGNGGNTAWWDGQIVGAWLPNDDAVVHVVPAWLDGVRISNVYSSPLMKHQPLP